MELNLESRLQPHLKRSIRFVENNKKLLNQLNAFSRENTLTTLFEEFYDLEDKVFVGRIAHIYTGCGIENRAKYGTQPKELLKLITFFEDSPTSIELDSRLNYEVVRASVDKCNAQPYLFPGLLSFVGTAISMVVSLNSFSSGDSDTLKLSLPLVALFGSGFLYFPIKNFKEQIKFSEGTHSTLGKTYKTFSTVRKIFYAADNYVTEYKNLFLKIEER